MADYSPVHDAISRIAAVGAPQRDMMTAGFVAYGLLVLGGAAAVRQSPLKVAWPAVVINALSTVAVAALPLDHSSTVDGFHGAAATVGYISLACVPLLAARPLRDSGRTRAAAASLVTGVAIAACLAATPFVDANGLTQRLGLTIGDAWLITAGIAIATDRIGAATSPAACT